MQPSTTPDASAPATLMDRLKAETFKAHEQTEAIPFNACIMAKTMPQPRYAAQLDCWHRLHVVLESALASSDNQAVQAVWNGTAKRAPLLQDDLDWHVEADTPAEAKQATTDMVDWVNTIAGEDPVCLLGVLYVLEGSTLGGMILRKCIAQMYGITADEGLAYYSAHGNEVMPNWMQFKARMNEAVTCPEDQDRIVETACTTFQYIADVLRGLSMGMTVEHG